MSFVADPQQRVENWQLDSSTARENLLTNGGFEIWQRGLGPFGLNNWTADRWYTNYSGAPASFNASITAVSGVEPRSKYAWQWTNFTTSGGAFAYLMQVLSDVAPSVAGSALTFSMRVKCSAPNAVRLRIYADASAGAGGGTVVQQYSAYHSGSNAYETLSCTITTPANCNYVSAFVYFEASCAGALDNAMLVVGSVPAEYAPLHPSDEIVRCRRYYQKSDDTNSNITQQYAPAGGAIYNYFPYTSPMGGVPTTTKIGSPTVSNCNQPTAYAADSYGYAYYVTATALGTFQVQWSAAAYFQFEWSP